MKKITLILLTLACTLFIYAQKEVRGRYNFNSDWLISVGEKKAEAPSYNDKNWKKVTLPRAFNEDDAFSKDIIDHTDTVVWYRKHFVIPASEKGKKVFIEFEGVRQAADVYLNGKHIGLHENGVMGFGYDLTNDIKFGGKNVIALRIDNNWKYRERETNSTWQWNNSNFNANYGGIPKNVILHVTGKLYQTLPLYNNLKTTGVYVYAQNMDIAKREAIITAESEVYNEYSTPRTFVYQMEIEDMDGKKTLVKGSEVTLQGNSKGVVSVSKKMQDMNFWSWGYGYLYNVTTSLVEKGKVIDQVKTRTGFRKTRFEEGMFWLNDRVLQLKGYAQRTSNEWPSVGISIPAWLSDYSNKLVVEGNGNLIRWMHVTPWKQDVESCDRVGLIHAMPAGDAEKDAKGRQWEMRVELMRDAIIYNRNNPSIIFYECGNESISEEHMAEMKTLRDKYDPFGGRAIGSREMLDSRVAEYGGEMLYINKSARLPFWATEYSRDEGLRKYWDEFTPPYHKEGAGPLYRGQDASAYNHNQDQHAIQNVRTWFDYFRERPGTGKRVSMGGANIIFSDSNTHYRGEENYRRSGEVDAMRIPKDAFWAHYVMWDGWVDLEKHRTHIVGHWNYEPKVVKPIYVISTGDKVELFVNGKSKGFGKQDYQFLFTFNNIGFEAGKIEAISYDSKGNKLSSYAIETAGEPVAIRMKQWNNPNGVIADGADMVLVEFEVIDAQGRRCPTSNQMIDFDLKGEAEWRGGIAQGPNNYILAKSLPVECGVNRVLLRSTTKAGKVTLTASANGLTSSSISFNTVPFESKGGLSEQFPADNLPSNMERGATPNTPSYTVKNVTVPIIGAIAGSNNMEIYNSYDDNELSQWDSDGVLANAWIKYNLGRSANVKEIVLKMGDWRNRSYPITIKVGEKIVWTGNTERSLGYVHIPIEPTMGNNVTIQLTGANSEGDAFGTLVELAGHKEVAKSSNKANQQLRIVEVEVNE